MKGMLSCSTLHKLVRNSFLKIKNTNKRTPLISSADMLTSGFAVFSLKCPSLLQFETTVRKNMAKHNMQSVFQIDRIPSDTQMRERLDEIDYKVLRNPFKILFSQAQRSGQLDPFKYLGNKYLMTLDGSKSFNSNTIHCDNCCEKNHRDGSKSYYHNMLSGAIVHPNNKVVLPFAPEPIMKTDGSKKNDCEWRAAERFLADLKREHPHLKLIIVADGLFSHGPFIKQLKDYNYSYILVAKPKNHTALFEEFNILPSSSYEIKKGSIIHRFKWINGLAINDTHLDCMVNVLEYWEINEKNGKQKHWTWVTDFNLCEKNVYTIMRGGRARHKIENETFNTLKNQGYHFEHNFGHGKKNLSTVFAYLMMLAFFVDQLQQLGCKIFNKALARFKRKNILWESKRGVFFNFCLASLEDLWNALAYGYRSTVVINTS